MALLRARVRSERESDLTCYATKVDPTEWPLGPSFWDNFCLFVLWGSRQHAEFSHSLGPSGLRMGFLDVGPKPSTKLQTSLHAINVHLGYHGIVAYVLL